MRVFVKGLNTCLTRKTKLSQYRAFLIANGHYLTNNIADADAIIVWTCAFRSDVLDNSLAELQRYEKTYKADVYAAGCLPDVAPETLNQLFHGPVIRWRDDQRLMESYFGAGIMKLEEAPCAFSELPICENAVTYRNTHPHAAVAFPDEFIKLVVQEGCPYQCSYCSERLAFPPLRSFPVDDLVESFRKMVMLTEKREVMLLSDCLGAYGRDIGTNLVDLLNRLLDVDSSLRFALNNYNLADFISDFDSMTELLYSGVFAHLNLPIQSASDRILKLMNRPYRVAEMQKVFTLLNNLDYKEFDTHIIIGFPGETEEDFDKTLEFILKHHPKYVLSSTYMESPGMASAKLYGKVDLETIRRRAEKASELMNSEGIICNAEEGSLMKDRLQRINFIS